jgi:hypothetical protein
MFGRRLARRGSIWLLACGLSGCRSGHQSEAAGSAAAPQSSQNIQGSEPGANMGKQMKTTTNKQLIISKENDAEEMVRIGTVNFDASNHASLSTEGAGPDIDELKQAWTEISKAGELTWKQSRPDTVDGESVTRIVGVSAKPGDESYIYAVMNTLERKYDYTVDIAK